VFVNNPFRYIGQFIVKVVRSTFEEISSGEFKKIEAELSLDQPLAQASASAPPLRSDALPETIPTYSAPPVVLQTSVLQKPVEPPEPVVQQTVVAEAKTEADNESEPAPAAVVEQTAEPVAQVEPAKEPTANDEAPAKSSVKVEPATPAEPTKPTAASVRQQEPSSRMTGWKPPYEDVIDGNRLNTNRADSDESRVMPSANSPDAVIAEEPASQPANSSATPDPLLYIKNDPAESPPLYTTVQYSKDAKPDDPWFANPEPN
jgi:hypothetical protein